LLQNCKKGFLYDRIRRKKICILPCVQRAIREPRFIGMLNNMCLKQKTDAFLTDFFVSELINGLDLENYSISPHNREKSSNELHHFLKFDIS
jgi:hypothetical protein